MMITLNSIGLAVMGRHRVVMGGMTMMHSLRSPLWLLAAMFVTAPAVGQDTSQPIVIGERAQVESRVLGETREIWISKPWSYDGGITASDYSGDERRYAVLYVLDAELHFGHVASTARFLAAHDRIPEVIVIAIPNTDRNEPTATRILSELENAAAP